MRTIDKIENILAIAKVVEIEHEGYYQTAKRITTLKRLAKRLSTIDVYRCNGTRFMGENGDEEYSTAYERVYVQIKKALEPNLESDVYFYHQSDPRGCSLYLSTKPLNNENYSGVGLAVLN